MTLLQPLGGLLWLLLLLWLQPRLLLRLVLRLLWQALALRLVLRLVVAVVVLLLWLALVLRLVLLVLQLLLLLMWLALVLWHVWLLGFSWCLVSVRLGRRALATPGLARFRQRKPTPAPETRLAKSPSTHPRFR